MTVTKRKAINRDPNEERVPSQTGVSYACDVCAADISHTVRIRCAQSEAHPSSATGQTAPRPTCEDFDLCGSCFIGGKEVGRHRRWHDYRVVEPHAYPIFNDEWGADEELLMIDACQQYGLGNWMDIAEHIGSFRSKDEVEKHYYNTYIRSPHFPLPYIQPDLDPDHERFQQRKKARLEMVQSRPPPVPVPKPGPSVPVCHEVGGFMPARLEFEHEFDNDAEVLIKDMEFGLVMRYGGASQPKAGAEWAPETSDVKVKQEDEATSSSSQPSASETPATAADGTPAGSTTGGGGGGGDDEASNAGEQLVEEDEEDLDLKLAILDIYNERINKRIEIKSLLFDRNLIDYRKIQANDRKRTKEEKDIIARNKPFARVQSRVDHEVYVDGLLYEVQLRKRIAELQEYRKAGLTSFSEIEKYEKDKVTHYTQIAKGTSREWAKYQKAAMAKAGLKRAPTGGLSLANSTSLSLLTPAEQLFCSRNRMLPRPFLFIKQTLLREVAMRQEELSQSDAAALFPTDSAEAIWAVWKLLFDPSEEKQLEEEAEEQKPVVTSALPAALSTVNGDERDGSATPAAAPLPSAINVDSPSVLSSLSQPAPVVQVNGSLTG